MMQMTQKDFKKAKKILEINFKNPLIQKLEKIYSLNSADSVSPSKIESKSGIFKDTIEQLFDNSELIEEASEQVNSMIPRIYRMMLQNVDNLLKSQK